MRPAATIFMPSFNAGPMLCESLQGFAEQNVSLRTVVVDNGSSDGSVQVAKREFPEVEVVELASNHGFGPALNEAVRRHPAERLVFVNNDVNPEPDFVGALLDELGRSPASVAGVLLTQDDPRFIDSAGVVVESTLLAFDYLHGLPALAAETADAPLGPTGAAALVPLSAFEAVGGFDERMFAYLEDVDLALRLRASGVLCRLAPAARAVHRHSATLGSGSPAKNRLMGWSRGYMLRRYGVLRSPRRAARALAAEAAICLGQAVIDRTFTGWTGRVCGWRAARDFSRLPIPDGVAIEMSLLEALRLRAARRTHGSGYARASKRR